MANNAWKLKLPQEMGLYYARRAAAESILASAESESKASELFACG
jgi:hypothetical protein